MDEEDLSSLSSRATPDSDLAARRSRSGRVVKAPVKSAPSPAPAASSASKRKRDSRDGEDAEDDGMLSDGDASEEPDAASDGDHPAPRMRKPSTQAARMRKPSSKKPRINGAHVAALGPLARIPSRPKKTVRIDAGEKGTGLFAEVFGSGDSSDTVAQQWLERYRQDDATAMVDLINCILQCAGCDLEVTADDIRDPENIPNRLVDLQNVYQEKQITEYPLISRAKNTRSFREMLVAFFHSTVSLLHETEILYKEPDLMDFLHSWLASMSSSTLRPFRRTATTVALAVQAGLISVAAVLDRRLATIEQQSAAAQKGKNKSKAVEIERSMIEANSYRRTCSEAIQSFFDTVFVHRYRDVEPKIRTECVEALGSWIWSLPTVFMEPGYLRYLGWMLSDTNAPTRHEVLKQLQRVFKRDAQQLGHFIDRFRPRLIEMATLDSEVSVRVAAINVIDSLRAAALLEPHEIDAIGKLIFDTELRIRKAVVGFFVACIHDVHQGKLEEMGGADVLDDLDEADEDDYESPRKEWLNVKCLAETLAIYDAQIEEAQHDAAIISPDAAVDLLETTIPETRISLAAQVLYEKLPEVKTWELLTGYLLFDHTTSRHSKNKASAAAANSTNAAFKKAVAPSSAEESILLDVLSSAIKSSLVQAGEHDRSKRKGHRSEAAEAQEEAALELTSVIPNLLNKFGAEPETAAIVLRLEHCLNLDAFQHLRQDSSKYEKLLDEISTQFNRHDDKRVLSAATSALLHARQYEELEELTDSKISLLWENAINALRDFDKTCELSIRGNLTLAPLRELSTTLLKLSKLASVSDCVDSLEAQPRSGDSNDPAIEILSNIVHRGKFEPQEDEIDDLEDEVVSLAIKTCQFYFMWKTRALSQQLLAGAAIADAEIDKLSSLRQSYRRHLIETFSSRVAVDQIRLFATGSLCDLHLTFATLRRLMKERGGGSSSSTSSGPPARQARFEKVRVLMQQIEPGLVPELISIFDGAEKLFAKKAKKDKTLNEPAEDEDPLDDDDDMDDDDEDEGLSPAERFAAELAAEKALCELTAKYVLALTAELFDTRGAQAAKLRRRILRNKAKLGNNFKEVVAYLEGDKLAAAKRSKKVAGPGAADTAAAAKNGDHRDAAANSRKTGGALNNGRHANDDGDDEEDEQDNPFADDDDEPEEGSREDLRRRELLDDDPIDDEEDEDERRRRRRDGGEGSGDDDDVLGD